MPVMFKPSALFLLFIKMKKAENISKHSMQNKCRDTIKAKV